jgi:hypothetical protein
MLKNTDSPGVRPKKRRAEAALLFRSSYVAAGCRQGKIRPHCLGLIVKVSV